MAIYTYKCPACGKIKEVIQKMTDKVPLCNHKDENGSGILLVELDMEQVLSVPSPPQWNCRRPS